MDNLENLKRISEVSEKFNKMTSKFNIYPKQFEGFIKIQENIKNTFKNIVIPKIQFPNLIPKELEEFLNAFQRFSEYYNNQLTETFSHLRKMGEKIQNNPEMQFAFISDLELLSLNSSRDFIESLQNDYPDEHIKQKEAIIEKNLKPYLENLGIYSIWYGADYALRTKIELNPDKLRHSLVSLRTLLEYFIDNRLAPKEKLAEEEMFKKEFKDYHSGKKRLELVRINRSKKIEYFTSKIQFGLLDEFTKRDIEFICNCYYTLCNIHSPNIGLSDNQVRILRVKTGITIWLLAYIDKIINR